MTAEQAKILANMQRVARTVELEQQVRRVLGRIEGECAEVKKLIKELDALNKDKAEECSEKLYTCGAWIMMEAAK